MYRRQNVNVSEVQAKKLTVFMARVELKVRFPGQWLLLYVAAEEGNARVPDLGWEGGAGGVVVVVQEGNPK